MRYERSKKKKGYPGEIRRGGVGRIKADLVGKFARWRIEQSSSFGEPRADLQPRINTSLYFTNCHSLHIYHPRSPRPLNVVCRRKHTFAILCLVLFPPLFPPTPNHHVSRLLRTTARTVAASASPCPATCVDCPNDALTTTSLLSTDTTCRVWWEPIPALPSTRRKWRRLCSRIWRVHQRSYGTDGLPSGTTCDEGWSGIRGAECVYQ